MKALLRIVTEDKTHNYIQNTKGKVQDTEDLLALYRELTAGIAIDSSTWLRDATVTGVSTISIPRFNSDDIPF
jgi:hypothetical protein